MSDVNEPQVRQLKLASGEEVIGYVSNLEKGTVQFEYPLQILTNVKSEMFSFKPWWSVGSPIVSCMVNTSHIIASLVPDEDDIRLFKDALSALVTDYEEVNIHDEVPPDQIH